MITCEVTLPDAKILDFGHFISLDRMNSVFLFNNYKKMFFFSFLAAGFCPKNLAFARKIMVLPESGGAAARPAPLARTPMHVDSARAHCFGSFYWLA